MASGSACSRHADNDHTRWALHLRLQHWLHGRRQEFRPLFRLSLRFSPAQCLGLVISNSLLLLFICWELVGLASYLLIGFWIERPSAAAAAKKRSLPPASATRDFSWLALALWPERHTSFYDGGNGCSGKCRSRHARRERRIYCASNFLWRGGQVGAIPAARLVAGCDGRPDAG